MQIIPLQPIPAQTVNVLLASQNCQIVVSQKSTGMFLDLYIDAELIVGGVRCENKNRIVRDGYLGFIGDLMFADTQGTSDPVYTGLGDRYLLVYIDAADLAAAGF